MEFEKLSKAELVVKAQELFNIVENQKHLAAAVEAKDKEISEHIKAKQKTEQELIELKNLRLSISQANATVEFKNQELIKIKNEFEAYKKNVPSVEVLENLKKEVKLLEEKNKNLIDFLNPYVSNVRSFLKGIQGTLELGIENEALLSEKLNKK